MLESTFGGGGFGVLRSAIGLGLCEGLVDDNARVVVLYNNIHIKKCFYIEHTQKNVLMRKKREEGIMRKGRSFLS